MNIQVTEDYSLFKRIEGNRTVNKAQVRRLEASIAADPELTKAAPIIVNDKFEVIDGQHRLEVLKKLGLPVYYMQLNDVGLEEVQKLNSASKIWTPLDYAESFKELGNKHYKIYLEFRDKYKLSHNTLVRYLGNGARVTAVMFRAGKFKVKDVARAHLLCSQLLDMKQFYDRGDSKMFAFAFERFASLPDYDHERMIFKAKKFALDFIKDATSVEEHLRQLEALYNYHVRREVERVRAF